MRARRIDTLANRNRNRLPNHGAKWKKALAWAVAAWTLGMAPEAFAHPILDAAGAGVNVATAGNVMNITSSQPNNLIKWVDFSISGGKTVDFHEKNYLNYVTGSAVSDIQGTLKGTGNIYLVNPNGILIGDGATVNVGSLHLSTKDLTGNLPTSFADGMSKLTDASIGGDVINLGTLKATNITVEGNNITFKNVANVNDGSAANVTLTANSTGEIHIGSAEGTTSGYTVNGAVETDYKLVHNAEELQNMKDNLAGKYMLAGDIDMDGFAFTPIGSDWNNNFTGKFDGLNYKIMNLKINLPTIRNVGLFGYNRGRIENVGMVGGSIKGYIAVGGIVGSNDYGMVRNVYNTGTVSGDYSVGGIVGDIGAGTVMNAYNTGTVSGTQSGIGGIAGSNSGTVTNAYNTGKISGNKYVGGIVGHHVNATKVENAYNTGEVSGTSQIGGIVGCQAGNHSAFITNVYNSGTVNGDTDVGGIVGQAVFPDNVTNKYTSDLTTRDTFAGFDFSENGTWRIYEGKTMPLLTAFLTRKDKITTTTYNGSADVGAVAYQPTTYSGVQAQNGFNYIKDACIVTPRDLTVSFGDISKAYDGTTSATAWTATLNGILNSDAVSLAEGVTATYDNKNAGTNKTVNYSGLALTGDKAKNYNLANATATGKGTITAKTITATFADVFKTYDGGTSVTAGAGSSTGIVTGDTVTITGTANFTDKNVGTGKTVSYTGVSLGGADAGNYSIAATATGKGSIAAKLLTATFNAISKTYDGNTSATAGGWTLSDVVGSEDVRLGDGVTAAYADKSAGASKIVRYEGITLSGAGAGNYTIASTATGTGSITPKGITATFADVSKIYDGGTSVTAGAGTLSGLIGGDTVNVTGTANFEDKNVGTGKTVNYTGVALDGTDAGNYTIAATATGNGKITAKEITATFADISKTYDGTTAVAAMGAGALDGKIDGDDVSVTAAGAAYADKNAGAKTVTYTDVTLTGAEAANYTIADTATGNGTITAKEINATFADISRTYDGTTTATAGAGTLAGVETIDEGEVSVSGVAAYDTKHAGTQTVNYTGVALTGGEAANYTVADTATGSGTIEKANVTFTVEDYSREYDGTESTEGARLKTVGTIYGSDTVSGGTFTLDSRNAGTRALSVSGVTIDDGNGGNNYNVTFQDGTGTITAAPLPVSTDAVTKEYDGTTSAVGAARVASGTLYGADAISGGTFAFADKNAGTGKAIVVSGVTVSDGNNGGNYNVTYQSGTGTITAAPLTISTDAVTKEYDGTTSAAGAAAKVASGQLYGADAISGGTFAFADKNAGTGKAITVSNVTINDGNGGNNYNVTYQSGTGTITRKALELVADAKTITEGEARPAFTGRVLGFVEGEGLESASDLAFASANPAAAAAGIYKVTGRLKGAASGDYGMNYTFANAAANDTAFTIEARSILPQEIVSNQIEASGAAQEYTGTVTALESDARAENQAALPQQEKFAGGTTANYVSHLTIENGGTNTPPNMDVAAAMSGEKAEQTATPSANTKAAPSGETAEQTPTISTNKKAALSAEAKTDEEE